MTPREQSNATPPAPLTVTSPVLPHPLHLTQAFRIGRSLACQVCIPDDFVSRVHAEVTPTTQGWLLRDLNSGNGLYREGQRISSTSLTGRTLIRLGANGPELTFDLPQPAIPATPAGDHTVLNRYADRYFRDTASNEDLGEHTQFIRRAFAQVKAEVVSESEAVRKRSQARRTAVFSTIIVMLLLAALAISLYAWRLHQETTHQRELARNIFYSIKALDIEIAQVEQTALAADRQRGLQQVSRYEASRRQLQQNYDKYIQSLHVYKATDTEQHRLILRVARIFGECELDLPKDFEQEINRYIKLWQSSGRFARDIHTAQDKGYTRTIAQALLERGLPTQFFYLAMQESDFNPYATGPITRKGYAKGMWQFIPETGVHYGLRLGPLADLPRPDPADERDQVDKATAAASSYLDMLYTTDAQASGLLVMACYNWGEGSVLPLVRSLPANPRQRNFWRLLAEHREQIPQQTYDYVFYITAAAVIGENPRLFGFNFDNPLANDAMQQL